MLDRFLSSNARKDLEEKGNGRYAPERSIGARGFRRSRKLGRNQNENERVERNRIQMK